MKNILKNALLLLSLSCFTACEINDPVDDWARTGQQVPHTIWELSSTKVKAGDSLAFKAQYYTNGEEIENMAVWYDLTEVITMTAKCPIVSFNYSLSLDKSTLSRENQQIIRYSHSENYWDSAKKAYIFNSAFPTSSTLRPVEWKDVVDFDITKYQLLFPDTFANSFKKGLYEQLSKTEKLTDYRTVLVTAGNMTVEAFNACLDSTYNSNSASYDKFVKSEKVAELKSKFDAISFKDLIYKSSESKYQINYLRSYNIGATFRVYDKKNNEGVTEKFSIEII